MENIFELASKVPFEARFKYNMPGDKFSEIEKVYKQESVIITRIDIDISLKWWYKIERINIEGVVKRTVLNDGYRPPTIEEQFCSPMFTEKTSDFSVNIPKDVDINEFLEVL